MPGFPSPLQPSAVGGFFFGLLAARALEAPRPGVNRRPRPLRAPRLLTCQETAEPMRTLRSPESRELPWPPAAPVLLGPFAPLRSFEFTTEVFRFTGATRPACPTPAARAARAARAAGAARVAETTVTAVTAMTAWATGAIRAASASMLGRSPARELRIPGRTLCPSICQAHLQLTLRPAP